MSVGGPSSGVVQGEFLEVVAPRRLVFTWGWEGSAFQDRRLGRLLGPSVMEISLESVGGGTLLRLRQEAYGPKGVPGPVADIIRMGRRWQEGPGEPGAISRPG